MNKALPNQNSKTKLRTLSSGLYLHILTKWMVFLFFFRNGFSVLSFKLFLLIHKYIALWKKYIIIKCNIATTLFTVRHLKFTQLFCNVWYITIEDNHRAVQYVSKLFLLIWNCELVPFHHTIIFSGYVCGFHFLLLWIMLPLNISLNRITGLHEGSIFRLLRDLCTVFCASYANSISTTMNKMFLLFEYCYFLIILLKSLTTYSLPYFLKIL